MGSAWLFQFPEAEGNSRAEILSLSPGRGSVPGIPGLRLIFAQGWDVPGQGTPPCSLEVPELCDSLGGPWNCRTECGAVSLCPPSLQTPGPITQGLSLCPPSLHSGIDCPCVPHSCTQGLSLCLTFQHSGIVPMSHLPALRD